jgi:hypothetical protein
MQFFKKKSKPRIVRVRLEVNDQGIARVVEVSKSLLITDH